MPYLPSLPFVWKRYSKTFKKSILSPQYVGKIQTYDATKERLLIAEEGGVDEGNFLCLYILVSLENGALLQMRYQAFGQTALIGALEALGSILEGKNYDQARRLSADLIESSFKEKDKESPREIFPHLNLVLEALDEALLLATDIPLPEKYVRTPLSSNGEISSVPDWETLSNPQKFAVLEEVIDKQIRPYVELDAGGIKLISIEADQITIGYEGACTSCFSATSGTLSAVQHLIRTKVHPSLNVVPDMTTLKFK